MTKYLTTDEYADLHGVTAACVRAWINDGLLQAIPPCAHYQIADDAPRPAKSPGRPKKSPQSQQPQRLKKSRKKSA